MTPDIQQAFEAWWAKQGIKGMPTDMERSAFEAGHDLALGEVEQVVGPRGFPWKVDIVKTELGRVDVTQEPSITAEAIYAYYPRKVGRSAAIKAIQKAGKGVGMERLLKAVKAYAEATSRWPAEERQYIPHPQTWFNQGRYDDDPKEWERGSVQESQFSQAH